MSEESQPRQVSLQSVGGLTWSHARQNEPLTVGLPLPRGAVFSASDVSLQDSAGVPRAVQARALDLWPDRSIRWLLVDTLINARGGRAEDLVLRLVPSGAPYLPARAEVTPTSDGLVITTGRATFAFSRGGSFPVSGVAANGGPPIEATESGLRVEYEGRDYRFRISTVSVQEAGPLRVAIEVGALAETPGRLPLVVAARIEAFASSATLRMSLTLTNPRRADHPGGVWPMGDKGSLFLNAVSLAFKVNADLTRIECAAERNDPLTAAEAPFEIHQESSAGEAWNGPVHKNRAGDVPLRFPGYRRRDKATERFGRRATPIVVAHTSQGPLSIAVPKFWERFPQAVGVRDGFVEIGLLPRDCADVHELQGGERKTDIVVVAFAPDRVSDPPLAWVHDPALVYPGADWCARTGAVPFLAPAGGESDESYSALAGEPLDPGLGFIAKREFQDEYGWRNFGDLPADHESAFQPAGHPFVSHYNNQYDAVAAFAVHFLRTGDRRWWALMTDLASHVCDIDIYHTVEDKAAYNGGLFWHTAHYTDAGTSSHRTYPKGGPLGGGPSAEHNYNVGLMLHHFMTGEPASRDAAIGLGSWVLALEDGRRTVFRWLAGGPTGLGSESGSNWYHGPGRASANCILACLVAHRLSGDPAFAAKADELIRRCIHPADDVDACDLLDVERRWFYTVFLQVLGAYLQNKVERGEFDDMFVYVRDSLLHYGKWMAANERPYFDKPEVLEFPNETWPAQDLRKAEVFLWAALHAAAAERPLFLERARFFRSRSLGDLSGLPTRRYTRPTVLVLGNGFRLSSLEAAAATFARPGPPVVTGRHLPPTRFESQKVRAVRRFVRLIVAAVVATLVAGAVLLFGSS